jgi:hypothetical protein
MDFRFLGAYYPPTALSLYPAHRRYTARKEMAETVAVGHLVKTVRGGNRPNLDGFKQDCVRIFHKVLFLF